MPAKPSNFLGKVYEVLPLRSQLPGNILFILDSMTRDISDGEL